MFYSQNDKRWSKKKLGKSKYTVGDSGCLVTAVQNGLTRLKYFTNPGIFTDWGNDNKAFQDPLGYLIFDSLRRYTKGKYRLVESKTVPPNKKNTLHEVYWYLKNGKITKHWVDQDTGRDAKGFIYVIDSWDGVKKSINQYNWKPTGRKIYIVG